MGKLHPQTRPLGHSHVLCLQGEVMRGSVAPPSAAQSSGQSGGGSCPKAPPPREWVRLTQPSHVGQFDATGKDELG